MMGVSKVISATSALALSLITICVIGVDKASGCVAPSVAITGIPTIHSLLR